MNLKKPSKLLPGDTIGLVSPSSGMAGNLPSRTQRSVNMLEELGFSIKLGPNALKVTDYTAGSARERADDLNEFFRDPSVKAIITFIGGNHSNQILPYLDFEQIRKTPKIFVGYSDITVLQLAIYQISHIVTFSGPALMPQFGENPTILPYTWEWFQRALMNSDSIGKITPAREWTDEFLDWYTGADLERPRHLKPNSGFDWIRNGKAEGKLLGGCITSLMHLRGTKYWPDFNESIFFWEIPEGIDISSGECVSYIDSYLTDLQLQGLFDSIVGMIIGRPYGYTKEETLQLFEVIKRVISDSNFPVLFNVDFGHTDPMITIPIGVHARLDSNTNTFEIIERGTAD